MKFPGHEKDRRHRYAQEELQEEDEGKEPPVPAPGPANRTGLQKSAAQEYRVYGKAGNFDPAPSREKTL